ncbi:hypothetical protein HYH02_009462 [Chlamydomonas schloesseri]|uniref:Uncharacterized protein n=1 Tax=Chlamydomonas schloesseri TaxID=2026947 RepID=A0A835TCP2_9CHLO|nr:hypothetical protein HYH02_009462 [Chlamydomonas schloesseri]|eukprot:KAG2443047.1 hypothetical protein HYH02_009462 [Chlamydomonas schloesseri]
MAATAGAAAASWRSSSCHTGYVVDSDARRCLEALQSRVQQHGEALALLQSRHEQLLQQREQQAALELQAEALAAQVAAMRNAQYRALAEAAVTFVFAMWLLGRWIVKSFCKAEDAIQRTAVYAMRPPPAAAAAPAAATAGTGTAPSMSVASASPPLSAGADKAASVVSATAAAAPALPPVMGTADGTKVVELAQIQAMAGQPLDLTSARLGQMVVRGPGWVPATAATAATAAAGGGEDGDVDGGAGHVGVITCVSSCGAMVLWAKTGVTVNARLQPPPPPLQQFGSGGGGAAGGAKGAAAAAAAARGGAKLCVAIEHARAEAAAVDRRQADTWVITTLVIVACMMLWAILAMSAKEIATQAELTAATAAANAANAAAARSSAATRSDASSGSSSRTSPGPSAQLAQQVTPLSTLRVGAGPPLTYSSAHVGQLVVRGPGWSEKEDGDQDGGDGHLGMVLEASGLHVSSMGPNVRIRWCETGMETKLYLQQPAGSSSCTSGGGGGGAAASRARSKLCVAVVEVLGEQQQAKQA